jgi:hypothetical protein
MMSFRFNALLLVLTMFCAGCSRHPAVSPAHISLVNSGKSVKFQGIDAAILGAIQRDSTPGVWQTLIPVYRMPADTDVKDYQPAQPGAYKIQDSAVVFTPDTPFVNGKTYFMRFYHFDQGKSIYDMVKNKRGLGSQPYTDLVFSGE